MKLSQMFYLANWFFGARVLGRKRPLQTVLFISDKCNLKCKHCSVYAKADPHIMTYEEIRGELEYAYRLGSRFVDFEGGEVIIWRDGDYRIDDVIDLAREVGFFSATITTNAQLPFRGSHADSIWVSLDGYGKYHEMIRGEGTFARLEKNIAECGHPHLSVNMVVNKYNWESVAETIKYVKNNLAIESISINFYTPFPDAENLIPFRVGYHTDTKYLIDGNSLSLGADGVIRYTLLVISASGARNVSYEGLRCATAERRVYAFGRSDKTWSKARSNQWARLRGSTNNHYVDLYSNYFCIVGAPDFRNADDIRRVLRSGGRLPDTAS